MRKRISIGLAVLAVVGIGGYMLLQPKKGTVEWHKKRYLAACEGGLKDRWRAFRHPWAEARGTNARKSNSHREALVRSGYLVERIYNARHHAAQEIMKDAILIAPKETPKEAMCFVSFSVPSNKPCVVITARAENIDRLEELLGHLDYPPPTRD